MAWQCLEEEGKWCIGKVHDTDKQLFRTNCLGAKTFLVRREQIPVFSESRFTVF